MHLQKEIIVSLFRPISYARKFSLNAVYQKFFQPENEISMYTNNPEKHFCVIGATDNDGQYLY